MFFGAFDRHNLGDILLGHMAAKQPGADAGLFAGLATRDLRSCGGQRVAELDTFTAPLTLIHVGGELLDCDAAQAAYMLNEPEPRWRRQAPYVVARHELPPGSAVEFRAVGGVELAERDEAFRDEVVAALREAGSVSVRDRTTQALLADAGIDAPLMPDPVTQIYKLFGPLIQARIQRGDPYLAVQFAAECGDDATLAAFARGLDGIGLPVVLFRAGAAPWHDALEPYRRLMLHSALSMRVFESLNVWDICALIAGSSGHIGTSLHGRLVAESFGVPVLSLERATGTARKLRAYLATWSPGSAPLAPDAFADGAFIFPASAPLRPLRSN
ncbi:MAG: polysaccharide pyruvyl transferase family protein [Rhodocyclaceae bacterium]|nr:polysaccharide pyruvyl transferase family protein [Rhodocyclaceae bacterium]